MTRICIIWRLNRTGCTPAWRGWRNKWAIQVEMVVFNFSSDYMNRFVQSEMEKHLGIQFTEIPISYDDMSPSSSESVAALVAEKPDLGAIWSSDPQPGIFWGLNELDVTGEYFPAITCVAREEELQAWKNRMTAYSELSMHLNHQTRAVMLTKRFT